jgi:hypothetical protein
MPKFRLDVEHDYDFLLAGISCHEKPYRLCWAINNGIGCNLVQVEPLRISLKKNADPSEFSLFSEEEEHSDRALYLLSNHADSKELIPEHARADFFFIMKGGWPENEKERILKQIRTIPFVLMTYSIAPETLKSKENLVF